jgi:PAS domain S-box-containing protein
VPAPEPEKLNILLVDDQPAKLLSYEAVLGELGQNLIQARSAREALGHLLKTEVALVLIDVVMPDVDGFELATMIREHPRFEKLALIFVSAVQITEFDRIRGYQAGAVDYVPVPVVPDVLRAKVRVFLELHRKTRELEQLNAQLETRVADRTAALEAVAARLQESEQRRSLALAAGRMGSWEWDLTTGEYVWDAGQCRIFGVDCETFRPNPQNVAPLIHPDDVERMRATGWEAAQTGEPYQSEFRIVRPGGEVRWCIVGGAATRDGAGQPIRLSGVTHDVTERKLSEENLQHLNEELERLVDQRTREREVALAQLFEAQKIDTIGHLTGGVAHDFNNLLMAVLGSLELLKKRVPPPDERAHRLLDNAIQGAERGAALTQRLLAFARRQELRPQSVDLPGLVRGMLDLLERALGPGVQVQVNIPDVLPLVQVDANQLELAILNLAVNARDAMPLGGSLYVSAQEQARTGEAAGPVRGVPPGNYVTIAVTDTGIGMDAATLARASEPFFTTKGLGKGTGLGLSMVHGLAAQSGGAMTLSSEVGAGTTVQLWLPKAADQHGAADHYRAGTGDAGLPSRAAPSTILLVDDDTLVRNGTIAMLEDLGHLVVEADSADEALRRLEDHGGAIDLMITDHAMPGMKGLDLIRQLRTSHPSLPVILASGYAEIAEDEGESGVLRLSKPFRQSELATAIDRVAGEHQRAAANVVPFRT